MKIKKFFIYKKYLDEIWGKLVSKKFSRTKLLVFENYKKKLLKRFFLQSKYSYFKIKPIQSIKTYRFFYRNLDFIQNQVRNFDIFKKIYSVRNVVGLKIMLLRLYAETDKSVLNFNFKNLKPLNLQYYFSWLNNFFFKPNFAKLNFIRKIKVNGGVEFFYSTHIIKPSTKSKTLTLFYYKYSYYRKVSVFFGFKRVSDFMRYYKKFKIFQLTETDLYVIFQLKLDNFLNTLNLFPSIYFIQKFILGGNVFVNNSVMCFSDYLLGINQLVCFDRRYFSLIFFYLVRNLKFKKVFLNYPSFVEIDYKTLICLIFKLPDFRTINHPFSFDLHTDFFKPFR